jgi:hypothetical protein
MFVLCVENILYMAGMCNETHVPAGANGLGVRPPKHSMASSECESLVTSVALSEFSGTRPEGSVQISEKC